MIGIDEVFEARIASGGDDLVELTKDRGLGLLVLDDRLDHHLAILEPADVGGELEGLEGLDLVGRVEFAGLDRTSERLLDPGPPGGRRFVGGLDHDRVDSGPGRHLGDSGAHQPGADDAESGDAGGGAIGECGHGQQSGRGRTHRHGSGCGQHDLVLLLLVARRCLLDRGELLLGERGAGRPGPFGRADQPAAR